MAHPNTNTTNTTPPQVIHLVVLGFILLVFMASLFRNLKNENTKGADLPNEAHLVDNSRSPEILN